MVEYLKRLLDSGTAFSLTIDIPGMLRMPGMGLIAVDATGIVVSNIVGDSTVFAIPWSHISRLFIDEEH